jgi:3-keto-disaccharide hydrolase
LHAPTGEKTDPVPDNSHGALAALHRAAQNGLTDGIHGKGESQQGGEFNMRQNLLTLTALAGLMLFGPRSIDAAGEKVSGPNDPDFKIQGDYAGEVKAPDGDDAVKVGVQVIALGDGKFRAVSHLGGLPGDGSDGKSRVAVDGKLKDGVVTFESDHARGEIKDGKLHVVTPDGEVLAELKKIERKSPTLGARPPAGAVVLFDGTSAEAFSPGKMTDDGLLIAGATSKRKFGSCQLHVEFLLPFMPTATGQARGNSGCYLQGRYEVQMLDSFGLAGEDNECGALYEIKAPDVNMCFPPLSWQTYDIDYTAARYEGDKKVKNATITVKHNGRVIQQDVELPRATRAAPVAEGPEAGPVYLQDHGNPVRYGNIWLVEKP